MNKPQAFAATMMLAWLAAPTANAAGYIVIRADELTNADHHQLVMLPDGSVMHLASLKLSALFEVYKPGDSLVYEVNGGSLKVRSSLLPSQLLLDEPLAPALLEPSPFAGINLRQEVAIFSGIDNFFYASPDYAYKADALDGRDRLIYVGPIVPQYASYQPTFNPFQPDDDLDGVPNSADNCRFVANGPLLPDAGNNNQYDTNADGFGNRCDADLNGDCIVNAIDLGLFRLRFFATGQNDADFNGDRVVNTADLGILRSQFFAPPGPNSTGTCP